MRTDQHPDLTEVSDGRIVWLDPRGEREDPARRDLVVSACRFGERARQIVDDKLTMSAALMRAGEVEEARRLLGEVELAVRHEQVALAERLNELKFTRAMSEIPRVVRVTRSRMVRMLAVAMVGSAVSMMAVGGFSLARNDVGPSVIEPTTDGSTYAVPRSDSARATARPQAMVAITIDGKTVMVPADQADELRRLSAEGKLSARDLDDLDLTMPVSDALLNEVAEAAGNPVGTVEQAAAGATSSGDKDGSGSTGGGGSGSSGSTGGGSTGGGSGGSTEDDGGGSGSTGGGSGSTGSNSQTGGEIPVVDGDVAGGGTSGSDAEAGIGI